MSTSLTLGSSYVEAPELHAYFKSCAIKWKAMELIKLRHRVTEVRWSENESGWRVKIEDLNTGTVLEDFCHVLLNSNGILK